MAGLWLGSRDIEREKNFLLARSSQSPQELSQNPQKHEWSHFTFLFLLEIILIIKTKPCSWRIPVPSKILKPSVYQLPVTRPSLHGFRQEPARTWTAGTVSSLAPGHQAPSAIQYHGTSWFIKPSRALTIHSLSKCLVRALGMAQYSDTWYWGQIRRLALKNLPLLPKAFWMKHFF